MNYKLISHVINGDRIFLHKIKRVTLNKNPFERTCYDLCLYNRDYNLAASYARIITPAVVIPILFKDICTTSTVIASTCLSYYARTLSVSYKKTYILDNEEEAQEHFNRIDAKISIIESLLDKENGNY